MGKKKRRKKKPRQIARQLPTEDRRTEAVTVAWMLSTTVTLGALVCAGTAWLTIPLLSAPAEVTGVIPHLLLAVATVTGTVSLILMTFAVRFRRVQPPRVIIVVSTTICFFPFGVHLMLAFR